MQAQSDVRHNADSYKLESSEEYQLEWQKRYCSWFEVKALVRRQTTVKLQEKVFNFSFPGKISKNRYHFCQIISRQDHRDLMKEGLCEHI